MTEHKTLDKKDIQKKIRNFSQTPKWKNFLTFLVFIALAFIFWIIQYYQNRFEVDFSIPVYYTEIPAEIVVTNPLPDEIKVKVSDKGTTLLNYTLTKKIDPIEISLKEITAQKGTYTVNQANIYKLISDRLSASSEIKSITPETIEVNYSPLAQKEISVKLNGILLPASGYIISDSLTILPKSVTAFGDSQSLDTLDFIYTNPIENRQIDKNINQTIGLISPFNIRLSEKEVKLALQVEEYTERVFEIPVNCVNLPDDRIIRFFPSNVEVHVQVGLSHYAELTASDFSIEINYNTLSKNTTSSYRLELTKFPASILNYRIVPETVEFLVEQKAQP